MLINLHEILEIVKSHEVRKISLDDVDNLISKRLLEIANTPLDERKNGWNTLIDFRKTLYEDLVNKT